MKFLQPLIAPLTQTIVPVLSADGYVHGFVPIAKQTFTQPAGYITLPEGLYQVMSVTIPSKGSSDSRPEQYMAIVYFAQDIANKAWLGISTLVTPGDSGYYSWYSQPTTGLVHHFDKGQLLTAMSENLDTSVEPPAPKTPPGVDNPQATIIWNATVNSSGLATISFFDFNWLALFQAKIDSGEKGAWTVPVLQVVSNPPGGFFKAALVQSPTIEPGGAAMFDTVRILKLQNPAPNTEPYIFTFNVVDRVSGLSTPCQFNLMVK